MKINVSAVGTILKYYILLIITAATLKAVR